MANKEFLFPEKKKKIGKASFPKLFFRYLISQCHEEFIQISQILLRKMVKKNVEFCIISSKYDNNDLLLIQLWVCR